MRDATRARNARSSGLNARMATCSVPVSVRDSDCIWNLSAAFGAHALRPGWRSRHSISAFGTHSVVNEPQPMQGQVRVDVVKEGGASREERRQPTGYDHLGVDP